MNHTLSPLTEPVGLIWLLALLATAFLVWKNRFRAAWAPGAVVIAFWVIGSTPLPARLLASLERPYAHPDLGALPEHDAVVMLGGVLEASSNDAFGLNLGGAADRVVTAAELMRRHKARALVLGGGSSLLARGPVEEGRLVENWLRHWNLVEAPIYRLGACANTRDEAARTAALAREQHWQRLLLVTSAGHMRRAEAIFRKLGLRPTCVACDFDGMAELEREDATSLFPKANGFRLLGLFWHEWAGWWYYRLRGWL